ncbi:MAG: lysophospholipid acyltransferase family protein, partial [Nitriliruptoraceae bacterium]
MLEGIVRGVRWLLRAPISVEGIANVPASGPAVLAFNHHSYVDFIVLAWAVVVRRRRPLRFLGKREIWNSRWVGWAPRLIGAIPIDRGSGFSRAHALDAAVEALRAGDLVVVAPEQTLSASFELLPFRTGAVRMAQRAGAPIVPVVGWGSQRLAARGIPRLDLVLWTLVG